MKILIFFEDFADDPELLIQDLADRIKENILDTIKFVIEEC